MEKLNRNSSGVFTCKNAVLLAVFALMGTFTISALTHKLSAGFTQIGEIKTDVEIDGQQFGTFDHIKGLKDLSFGASPVDGGHSIVTLSRDFVTDPSLYNWAREKNRSRGSLADVHLVMKDASGNEVSRYVLKLCQPLAWAVEAADPTTGGFHEKVDLAVQEIAIY